MTSPRTYKSSWRRVLEGVASGAAAPRAPSGAPPSLEDAPIRAELLGGRYEVLNRLGSGGMGTVYRALDRMNGRVVTLKRLRVSVTPAGGYPSADDASLNLAREFSLLASLRHPHIVSVLDYGFDSAGVPFFTMDLQESAVTIVEAARGKPLSMQVDLLLQTLRALAYLHRHGILHRDLKPDNVLVVGDQVRVLDFGLSAYLDALGRSEPAWIGTLPYLTPEMLRGEPSTGRSDLYTFGMIAYELLCGDYPFDCADVVGLERSIRTVALPRAEDDLDPRLRPWLARLLAKRPEERYGSAREVTTALGEALDQTLVLETVATRESFLQAAPFVGRRVELDRLLDAVRDAQQGSASTWLVGGESGVGKSRLLDELRTRALIRGVTVLRGQARSQGGPPYHLWHDLVAAAAVRVMLSDEDVAVLRAIVPDLGRLLGREVPEAPVVSPEAAQTRLLLAVEELFRVQEGTVLAILEDLQWARSESLRLLASLTQAAALRLVLVGSFRDEETPDLPAAVEGSQVLRLGRLAPDEIEALGVAMIGDAARRPEVAALLVRETEGIPFFLVEVVRALAESVKSLDDVASHPLPDHVLSGGMERIVRRRLGRVPKAALPALATAAVCGRVIDAPLLHHLHPEIDLETWTSQCAAAAVLTFRDQAWQFAHDKLREQVLSDLAGTVRRTLHRGIAEALEETATSRDAVVTALAHHWGEAGEPGREAEYELRAGMLALESGACREAVNYLTRALELAPSGANLGRWRRLVRRRLRLDPNARVDPDTATFHLAVIEGGLTDAYFRLGDLGLAREHGTRALRLFGHTVPVGNMRTIVAVGGQIVLRAAQGLLGVRSRDAARAERATAPVARVLMRLIDTHFYSIDGAPLAWSMLRMMNESAPRGPSPELARAYCLGALLAGMASARRIGEAWLERSVELAEHHGTDADQAWVLARVAVFRLSFAEWEPAAAAAARACVLAQEVGDLRSFEENRGMSALLEYYRGRYEISAHHAREAVETTLRSGDRQLRSMSGSVQAQAQLRLGRVEDALALCQQALVASESADALSARSQLALLFGVRAAAYRRLEDFAAARQAALRAAGLMRATAPVAYWLQGPLAHVSETLFALLESGTLGSSADLELREQAFGVVRAARQFARLFAIGRPGYALASGSCAWFLNRPRFAMARWRRALALATQFQMPYEAGAAHLELGRHLPAGAPARWEHLASAASIFGRLGCAWELARARALQEGLTSTGSV